MTREAQNELLTGDGLYSIMIRFSNEDFDTNDRRHLFLPQINVLNLSPAMNASGTLVVPDTSTPFINGTLNNTSPKKNQFINASFTTSDETALSFGQVIINQSGFKEFFNYTLSGTSDQFSKAITITASRGGVINITGWTNDSSNNYKQNTTIITVSDTLGTVVIGINNSSPRINDKLNITVNGTDIDSDFSSCTIAYNQTGIPTINFTFFPTSSVIHFNTTLQPTITLPRGAVLNFTGFCNDTIGTQTAIASQKITVANTNPTNATIIYPTENILISDSTIDINITYPKDADSDILTAYFYINGTLNSTSTGNSTFNASDGKYNLTVSLSDGTYLVNTTLNSFKIDTVFPVISGMPTNDSRVNIDTNYTITITDSNLYGANCSLYNGSNSSTTLLYSQEYTNIVSNSQQFLIELNTSNEDHQYFFSCYGSDDHTKERIGDYKPEKKQTKVEFRKNRTNDLKVDIDIEDKTRTPDSISITNYTDRVSYTYDYSDSLTKQSGTFRTFEYGLASNEIITYRSQSPEKAHFVIGSGLGAHWIDYNFLNNSNSNYLVTQINDSAFTISITTEEVKLNFSSVGGVNIINQNSTVVVDTINPLFNSFNLTNGTFVRFNQTILAVCTDNNIYNFSQRITRQDGTLFNQTHNQTNGVNNLRIGTFLNLNDYPDANYTWQLNCSDRHTANGFPDLDFSYSAGSITFLKKTNSLKNVTIDIGVYSGGEITKLTGTQITNFNVDKLIRNGTDRISFGASLDTPNTAVTFGFKIPKINQLKLIDSNQNALFMLHNNYWMDFKLYLENATGSQRYLQTTNVIEKSGYYGVYWTIDFGAYGFNAGDRINIITESIGGLNQINMFKNFAVDTTPPTITTLLNQSLSNSSINISGVIKDPYIDRGNFSHNATGTWQNSSFSSKGNTTYEFIIPYSSITLNREVSWRVYAYDQAGNEVQSATSSFTITSSPSTSNGAGGSVAPQAYNQPLDLANPFGIDTPLNGTCEVGYLPFNGKCFPCATGYLQYNIETGLVHCVTCLEGFKKEGNSCVLLPPNQPFNQINKTLDKYALKISSIFGTTNPLIGYFTILVGIGALGQLIVSQSRRKNG